jgi:hypothetical protein
MAAEVPGRLKHPSHRRTANGMHHIWPLAVPYGRAIGTGWTGRAPTARRAVAPPSAVAASPALPRPRRRPAPCPTAPAWPRSSSWPAPPPHGRRCRWASSAAAGPAAAHPLRPGLRAVLPLCAAGRRPAVLQPAALRSQRPITMIPVRRLEPSAGSGDSSTVPPSRRPLLLPLCQDSGPPCTAGAAWSLIWRGHAAASPVLVAATWQPSAVASSRWHDETMKHRTTTQVRPYGTGLRHR